MCLPFGLLVRQSKQCEEGTFGSEKLWSEENFDILGSTLLLFCREWGEKIDSTLVSVH